MTQDTLDYKELKIPLAKKGKWFHDHYGTVEFNDRDFESIINNYRDDVLGFEPYATYGHLDEEPDSTDSDRKRGDLKDIEVEGDVLYGRFQVPEETYNAVQNKQYEYSSGEFIRNFSDKVTGNKRGTAFLRVALTNSPFIPFKEKVQALSNNIDECSQNITPFVVTLSVSDNSTVTSTEPKEDQVEQGMQTEEAVLPVVEDPITPPAQEPEVVQELTVEVDSETSVEPANAEQSAVEPATSVEEIPTVSVVEDVTPQVLSIESQPEARKEENRKMDNEVQTPAFDPQKLLEQVANLQSLYSEQLEKASATISTLTQEVEALKGKLTAQEAVTYAFSTSMSKANEQALYDSLAKQGVTPVVIEKFSQIKSALEGAQLGNSVIKLSTSEGEKESNVLSAVAELLVEASKNGSINYQQFGVTSTRTSQDSLTTSLQEIISRNAEMAQKKLIK